MNWPINNNGLFLLMIPFAIYLLPDDSNNEVGSGSETITEKHRRDSYIAAVVEYAPLAAKQNNVSPEEVLRINSDRYLDFIVEAKLRNADIIVFPEHGLVSLEAVEDRSGALPFLVQVPEIGKNPCLLDDSEVSVVNFQLVKKLSCSARSNKIYLVVNLGEIRPCLDTDTNCPKDGAFNYNTNVVFNRDGDIVAKYRKHNLYVGSEFDTPPYPEYVTFETDFGVIFGTFTCFDIVFYKPAVVHVGNGIKNFIFTTAWYDELPFLTATQSNSLWAMSASANLIVSGYHHPIGGQLGSGIFSGFAGPLKYIFDPNSGSQLLVSTVPIIPYEKPIPDMDSYTLQTYQNQLKTPTEHFFLKEKLQIYSTVVLNLKKNTTITACHENFCCSLTYALQPINLDSVGAYRLIAFNGFRKVAAETAELGWQVCGVSRCLSETLDSCTERTNPDSPKLPNFTKFQLSTTMMKTDDIMKPSLNTLDIDFQPIPFGKFKFTREGGLIEVKSKVLQFISIQTVGIINRLYRQT